MKHLILFLFLPFLMFGQIPNANTTGSADATAAIQAALDNTASFTATANATYLISSTLVLDQNFAHNINWNGATMITNTQDLLFFSIDKRSSNGGLTLMRDLLIDARDIGMRGVYAKSRVELINIDGQDYAQSENAGASPSHIRFDYESNESDTLGEWVADGCDVDGLQGFGNYCDYCDGIGAANGYLVYWDVVPNQDVTFTFKNATVQNGFGVDGQNIGVFSSGRDVSYTAKTVFDNITTRGFDRRGWKLFCGGITVKNCLIQDNPDTDGLFACGQVGRGSNCTQLTADGLPPASAGLFTFGAGSGATGASNLTVENTTFVGVASGTDNRVIMTNTDDININNSTFSGSADLAFTNDIGDVNICGTTFESGSTVYSYNTGADTGQITFGTNNTYATNYASTNNIGSYSSIEANLSCPPLAVSGVDYYVTTTGNNTNDGLTENTAWSLSHAFATAVAGDVVAVKAGNYGALQINTTRNGTAANPIKFIGYTTTPGDIGVTTGSTYTYADWLSNSSDLPDNVMPHLELNPTNNNPNNGDDAFTINHSYIELHNFMISEFEIGVQVNASNVTLNNIIGDQFGNWDPNATGWNAIQDSFSYTHRDGYGIDINANNTTVTNSLIIDAGFVTFFIKSDNNTFENVVGVAERTGNGADYIWDFYGSNGNTIKGCTGRRTYGSATLGHRSRALSFQVQSDNNTLIDFVSVNGRIQIEDSRNNYFENISMTTANGADGENSVQIQVYGQSNDNVWNGFVLDGGGGISFLGDTTDSGQRTPWNGAGDNNYFINGKVSNLNSYSGNAAVSFHRLGTAGKTGGTNYFIGVTFDDIPWIINANRDGTANFYNCSFSGGTQSSIDTFHPSFSDFTNNYTANYINCNFFGNNFGTPTGTNITTGNPLLNANLEPQTGSALIDSGMNPTTISTSSIVDAAVILDINGADRPFNSVYDIGAFEFGATSSGGGSGTVEASSSSIIISRRRSSFIGLMFFIVVIAIGARIFKIIKK